MNRNERIKIAAKWRTRREKCCLSFEEFANAYRFDIGQLSRWETGKQIPTMTSVERVENALLSEQV